MNIEKFLQYENERQAAYQLLATFYSPPEEGIGKKLAELNDSLQVLAPKAAELIVPMKSNMRLEKLKVDHSALFIGPFKLLAPPYGSVYLEGNRRIMGESSIDARNWYRDAGLQCSNDFKEAPDHIVTELEFMCYLIYKEIEALEKSNFKEALQHLSTQNAFLRDHLRAWISQFAKRVENNAQTGFYRNLSMITRYFVQSDYINISDASIATIEALVAVV